MAENDERFERPCCIRGYHEYVRIWKPVLGETVECRREPGNTKDRYAVSVVKEDTIIRHLPRKVSKLCSLFLRRGGRILCTVLGSRQFSADLPQGGLQIPCRLIFQGSFKEVKKTKMHFPSALSSD